MSWPQISALSSVLGLVSTHYSLNGPILSLKVKKQEAISSTKTELAKVLEFHPIKCTFLLTLSKKFNLKVLVTAHLLPTFGKPSTKTMVKTGT